MDPQYLHIENFMGHRSTSLDLTEFQTALIVGKSKNNPRESNGVGKTTIFHAIEYALFGTYPTTIIDNIVRDGCESCKVVYDFIIGTSTYRVERIRSLKSKKSYIYFHQKSGDNWEKPIKLTQKTPTETQKEILKTIKINSKAFINSVLFAQSDLEGLASAKPDERRGILKEALSLEIYGKFEKIAKKKRDKVGKAIEGKKAVLSSLGTPDKDIAEIEEKLVNNKTLLTKKEQGLADVRLLLNEKKSLLSDIKHLMSSELTSVNDKLRDISSSKEDTQSKIDRCSKTLKSKSKEIELLKGTICDKRDSIAELNETLEKLEAVVIRPPAAIELDLESATTNENNGKIFVGSLKSKISDLRKPLPEEDVCPHCRQQMSEEHRNNCIKLMEEEVAKLTSEVELNTKRLSVCTDKKNKLASELADAKKHIANVSKVKSGISAKTAEVQNDNSYLKKLEDLESQASNDLELNKKKLSELESREESLKETADKLAVDDVSSKVVKLNSEIENLESSLKELLKEISSANTLEGILTERKDTRNKDLIKLTKIKKELEKLEKEYTLRHRVMKGFSPSGIPTMVIHTILDDLQLESNKLLADLKPGLELQFSISKDKDGESEDTLDMVFMVHSREREYQQLSGGQKLLFALSLKLGLSLIIQKRLGVDIKFLELDEVDAMLDKSAVDAFAEVIKKWQKFFKIFVITHNDMLKDKFDYAILVEGDENNGSTAKLVNSW